MAGELVLKKRIEMALGRPGSQHAIVRPTLRQIVDVPRECATYKRAYAARYIGEPKRWRHSNTFPVTEHLALQQYGGDTGTIIPMSDLGEEQCPWCGMTGKGAGYCPRCGTYFCYGLSTNEIAICACGFSGSWSVTNEGHRGIVPGLRTGPFR
jgi:hypothetical protein